MTKPHIRQTGKKRWECACPRTSKMGISALQAFKRWQTAIDRLDAIGQHSGPIKRVQEGRMRKPKPVPKEPFQGEIVPPREVRPHKPLSTSVFRVMAERAAFQPPLRSMSSSVVKMRPGFVEGV